MKRWVALVCLLAASVAAPARRGGAARQAATPKVPNAPAAPVAPGAPSSPATITAPSNPGFLRAADEVLAQMSEILSLPIKQPLKKSLRSKQEIRNYLIREEKEDKDDAQRYADRKALEAFGFIPKDFPLDDFLLDVLTDQIAGLYDPKAKEFYIADWIAAGEQRDVMAHELTHALEDQSFNIEPWIKAARPNDDAELARDSVSEGTAMAAMVDYVLRDNHMGVRDLPDVTLLLRAGALKEVGKDAKLSTAPPYIRDALLFPYLSGTAFSQQFLKAHSGWSDLKTVFQDPPVSTQQIMHPDFYLKHVGPQNVTLPEDWKGIAPPGWKLLEENVLGEFGLDELLKQYVGPERADALSPAWDGDRYAVFEDAKTKQTPLILLLALETADDAAQFFDAYSDALAKKYPDGQSSSRQTGVFALRTDSGGVFLRCVALKCLSAERTSRDTFDAITHALGWPPASAAPGAIQSAAIRVPSSWSSVGADPKSAAAAP